MDDGWFPFSVQFFNLRRGCEMASKEDPQKARRDAYIDQNLKKVFSELETDEMPDQIMDLLTVLRAQDEELKAKK
ncbi:NepR family anti-sigma factor [uncultured Tateyamaria sp.]|uniref:NepR family anti-sigma factor n=1 Tax=uncultured Tateyamaria sp. TaxID=455651 RepID=UPI0026320221|nr:NepR family anti-sigma factor [uncultured Tateyamaria sp.]